MGNKATNTNNGLTKTKLLDDSDKKQTTPKQHHPQQTGCRVSPSGFFRSLLPWIFLVLILSYVLYSSNLLLTSDQTICQSTDRVKSSFLKWSRSSPANSSLSSANDSQKGEEEDPHPQQPVIPFIHKPRRYNTTLKHVVFGISASSVVWETRKEYIKTWWRPGETRGVVWLDKRVTTHGDEPLPEIRISQNTSHFRYTHPLGDRSAVRLSRVVSETVRLGPQDVRWFVMGDDDTIFFVENVVNVLDKYDHTQFYYVGSSSEAHIQNIFFSYSMAFGGGGFAISYPLAKELQKMQDRCIQRYPGLYGSDDRIQACMAELGVPLTKEPGFHQYDIYGDLLGLLGAHPVAPLVSLHHIDVVRPIFPTMKRSQALRHLMASAKLDPASIIQQSICYDQDRLWSISVSWGFVVQIIRGVLSPRELEMPSRTFLNWFRKADYIGYAFNTRPVTRHPCQRPFVYYLNSARYDEGRRQVIGYYTLNRSRRFPNCRWNMESPQIISSVIVLKRPDPQRWHKSPRRDCCRVMPTRRNSTMFLWVGNCRDGEISELGKKYYER